MDKKKAAVMAAVTTAAAAGMVTGALFETPADLLGAPEPGAVVECTADDDGDAVEETRRTTPASRLRNWILGLPMAVRALVGVPLWTLGWVLLNALAVFWSGAAPVLGRVVSWLCLSLVLLAVFAATVKAAIPHLPLKTILRPRNIVFILVVGLVLGVADMALPSVWRSYDAASQLVWRVGATCLLAFVCCAAMKRHGKEQPAAQQARMSERTEVELAAMALADRVSPKY